ncbi:MAG: (2Fe-2S)-binding protein [Deltaproteobacteria bacterium]|nr:(2Fe-2S)-binding protein [Deltaproteobacteria bacterium]
MTSTPSNPGAPTVEMVDFSVDGRPVSAPKGTNLLEAMLAAGENLSYFCYHPGLSVAACCRQCMVAVGTNPKLVPACQMTVQPAMEVYSSRADVLEARQRMLEFTLVNHPVDCTICDKAGECALQRHYMDWDGKDSAINHAKVDKPKKVDLGPHIVLDTERCILCSRCVRFCQEVAKAPQLVFSRRGDHEMLTTAPGERLDNPYSLNTVDICPVGALTDKDFRFKIRVWELFSTRSTCVGCSAGCQTEIHHHRNQIYRLVPPKRWDMNLSWMCDDGRRTYKAIGGPRVSQPRVNGRQESLKDALDAAAASLRPYLGEERHALGVVVGADLTNEDAFASVHFARDLLGLAAVYLADRPNDGRGDGILRRSDPNPNRSGILTIAGDTARSTRDLAADIAAGTVRALLVVGDSPLSDAGAPEALRQLAVLVVQASIASPTSEAASVLLPAAAWAEVDGTITNYEGRVQRLRAAVEPPGLARPHWDLIGRLARLLGLEAERPSPEAVFDELRRHHPSMAHASWGEPMRAGQLRFAGRRG